MDCHEMSEQLLAAESLDHLSEEVENHLLDCPACRTRRDRLALALESLTLGLDEPADDMSTERIMGAIRREVEEADHPTPFRSWIIAGTLIITGLLGLRFSEVMNWLRQAVGPGIDVAMSLILGLFLTGYICMLVGSNLRRVQRLFRVRLRQ